MTWRQLQKLISELPEEHKDDHVTLYMEAEDDFVAVFSDELGQSVDGDRADGILDPGHSYLTLSDVS